MISGPMPCMYGNICISVSLPSHDFKQPCVNMQCRNLAYLLLLWSNWLLFLNASIVIRLALLKIKTTWCVSACQIKQPLLSVSLGLYSAPSITSPTSQDARKPIVLGLLFLWWIFSNKLASPHCRWCFWRLFTCTTLKCWTKKRKNKEALKLSVMLWGVTDALLEMHHLPTAHSNVTAF